MNTRNSDIELIALALLDMRGTIESMRRSVAIAEANLKNFRFAQVPDRLAEVAECLRQVATESSIVNESASDADRLLRQAFEPR